MNDTQRQKAYEYYKRHRRKITNDVETIEKSCKPSKEDINEPMLWKPEHWLWFMEH